PRLLPFVLYSVSCYVDHLDLHPFPTRRSSDLRRPRPDADDGGVPRSSPPSRCCSRWVAPRRGRWTGSSSSTSRSTTCRRTKPRRDRKSTRLNSSHVKISYAVFCLKKKRPIS